MPFAGQVGTQTLGRPGTFAPTGGVWFGFCRIPTAVGKNPHFLGKFRYFSQKRQGTKRTLDIRRPSETIGTGLKRA